MPDGREVASSDAELTESVRGGESEAAVAELYRRHRGAVFAYALTCCRDPHTAEDLTSEAFTRTIQAVRSGGGPEAAWRPYLLTAVRRTAADWARTSRRTELSTDFEQWATDPARAPDAESGEERMLRREDNRLVLHAFRSLPERWQTVLWHTVVEEEPAAEVGTLLGIGASGVASLASRAREGLREAYLNAHIDRTSHADDCRRFSALLAATVRRCGRRPNKDFERHLDNCARCRRALLELTDLNERIRASLAAEILLWGGSAYLAARAAEGVASATAAVYAPQGVGPDGGGAGLLAKAKASPLAMGAALAAVAAGAFVIPMLPFDGGEGEQRSSPPAAHTNAPPPATVTASATVTVTASASPSPTPTPTVGSSRPASTAPPARPPKPSRPSRRPSPTGPGPVLVSTTLVNAGNGACVDTYEKTVVQNPCDGSRRQTWEFIAAKDSDDRGFGWLRNAASGHCLDYSQRPERDHTGAVYIFAKQCPCRTDGTGQLFAPYQAHDGSYFVNTRPEDSLGDRMQLGMHRWWKDEGRAAPPENQRVVITYNYYGSAALRYRADF
ncbi:sigma-70 family RNA polymerase sigma factor [Streptomyces gobiensis]|uniref:sigma-70 family RNA polymerase sigma factor n=1 Tax=Streptomyces gobiensis TaxID=2875706 RepID=UPI001E2A65BA|nr:sigma-70 family RNA polymerase sigma factor [Streptomyces gobiensis]UGY94441.1 sigma-70 family RNA polymerase sigma factor [Streptomyces gobiensis]